MIMARNFELLNNLINDFYLYQQSNNFTFQNSISNLNKDYIDELDIISFDFIKNTMNLLSENILNGINTKIDSCVNINMIIFIVFIIFLVSGYLIIWMPFESRLKDDVC